MSTRNSRPPFAGGPGHGDVETGGSGEVDSRVGSLIRSKRTRLGLSAERLAEALGVTAARVEEWEIGARRVGGEHLRMISEILGAGPDAFFEIASSDSILPISFAQRLASPGPTVEECVRLVRAFRVITDTEAREAILALVVALSPDPMSQN